MIERKCYQDAVKHLKSKGYFIIKSNWWNPFAHCSQDLGGIFDCVACGDGELVGVQVTSHSNRSAHRKKIKASETFGKWIGGGGSVLLLTTGNVNNERGREITFHEEWLS